MNIPFVFNGCFLQFSPGFAGRKTGVGQANEPSEEKSMRLEGEKVRRDARGDREEAGNREQVAGGAEPMTAVAAWAMGYGSTSRADCKSCMLWTFSEAACRT